MNNCSYVSLGVHFLHELEYIHRDIKPANILRHKTTNDGRYTYKIADFGLAVKHNNKSDLTTICGTKRFMAPEMNGQSTYGPEVDVWSLGVLFYSLLVGKHSQVDATKEETFRPMKENSLSALYPNDLHISTPTQMLVNSMLKKEPWTRITLKDVIRRLGKPIEANKSSGNGTIFDSGIASSCTSGSSSANGSGTGFLRSINGLDRNLIPGVLQSVAEENTTLESGIGNGIYRNSVTPRTNFIRTTNNEKLVSNNTPIRPTYVNNPSRHERHDTLQNFSPIAPSCQQFLSPSGHYNFAPNMHSTVTVDSSYRNAERVGPKPAPLSTLRLRPSTKEHRTKKGSYCIMQDGSVKMELTIEKRARQNGEPSIIGYKETLFIASDGQTVVVKRNGGRHNEMTFSYDNLPEKYWAKYNKAAEVVKSFKATTPKILWTTDQATCKLMENGKLSGPQSDANFVVEFLCGIKLEYDAINSIVTVSEKPNSSIRNEGRGNFQVKDKIEFSKIDYLKPKYGVQCELFQKYHERLKRIEEHFEELQAKDLSFLNDMKDCTYFPLRLGPNKLQNTCSSSTLTPSTYSNTNIDNNENKNLLANQNRAFSAGELNRMPLNERNHIPKGQRIERHSPLPHTRSSPDMQRYGQYSLK